MSNQSNTEKHSPFVAEPLLPRPPQTERNDELEEDDMPRKPVYWIPTFLKITLFFLCCLGLYGIYLDGKIRAKMDGQIWQLPAEVYSRIESIRLSDNLTVEQVRQMLLDYGYREVSQITTPGDFKFDDQQRLVVARRAFVFPDESESRRILRMSFINEQLSRIEDLVSMREISEFRLDPKLISMIHSDNDEERQALQLHQYPKLLIDALLLTEDRRFYEHDGISLIAVGRAMLTNYQAGRTVQGGSTLTQQLVKNLFLTNEKSFERKINEALMSIILDYRYDKNTILETYLNEIYLGQNGSYQVHGFALASQFYFGRPINEISLSQIALLVGMVKGPSLYNPWTNPERAKERRNVVLAILLEHNVINQELYEQMSVLPLGVKEKGSFYAQQPAFMHALHQDIKRQFGEHRASTLSGAKIFTTLDRKLQRSAELAVIDGLEGLENSSKKIRNLQSAIVVAEYESGKVRAIVGDRNTQFAGFNRAIQTKRQIGSLVKPSIYAIALSQPEQFRLNTPINNQPITIQVKGSAPWSPRNYDRRTGGSVMLMDALVRSLNIPTVNIGMKVGIKQVIAKQKEMGWDDSEIPAYPSMLLGSYSISPYDVTKSYQTLANSGMRVPLTTIEAVVSHSGETIYRPNLELRRQVVPKEASIQTLYAMQQVVERGTARSLMADFAHLTLAGKTGTTNNARDTWFVGIDGKHITTVWLGKDDNSDTHLTGSSGALEVYKEYLRRAQPMPFRLPKSSTVQWVGISSFGAWDCASGRQIPVWRNKGQHFCREGERKATVWDALSSKTIGENGVVREIEEERWIPNEEIAPREE